MAPRSQHGPQMAPRVPEIIKKTDLVVSFHKTDTTQKFGSQDDPKKITILPPRYHLGALSQDGMAQMRLKRWTKGNPR